MDLLSQRIELQGFEKSYDPEGDGDCFYKAAAFQLGRDETHLKNEIFDFLAQNQYDSLRQNRLGFLCSEDIQNQRVPSDWNEALTLLRNNWANEMVIRALSEMLRCKVTIITASGETPDSYIKVIAPPGQCETLRHELYFGHTGDHYFALKEKNPSKRETDEKDEGATREKNKSDILKPFNEEFFIFSCTMIYSLNKDKEKVNACVNVLCRYLDNICKNPDETKYQKIKQSNKIFQERVAPIKRATKFLLACGFEEKVLSVEDSEEKFFILPKEACSDYERLKFCKDVLASIETWKPTMDRYRASKRETDKILPLQDIHPSEKDEGATRDRNKTDILQPYNEESLNSSCSMIYSLNKDKEKVKECVNVLCRYLDNICKNPDEKKCQKIKQSNKMFQERVAPIKGATEFLLACGFEEKVLPVEDSEEKFFILPKEACSDCERLKFCKEVLVSSEALNSKPDRYRALSSLGFDEKSKEWLQLFSTLLNFMLPVEYLIGEMFWFQEINEAKQLDPDQLWSSEHLTGSCAEGLCIPRSLVHESDNHFSDKIETMLGADVDVMSVKKSFETIGEERIPIFDITRSGNDPRYVLLRLTEQWKKLNATFSNSVYLHQPFLFTPVTFIKLFGRRAEEYVHERIHGPTRKLFIEEESFISLDQTVVFEYPNGWPESAMDWLIRPRQSGWPSPALIQDIFDSGCHLAPVGRGRRACEPVEREEYLANPGLVASTLSQQGKEETPMDEREWRISFSSAESKLGQSLSPVQRHIMVLLKIIKKAYLSDHDVISTYLLKNLFFWECEKRKSDFWREDNSAECLLSVMDRLVECLKERHLPHYIIPESNLLMCGDPVKLDEAAETVLEVRKNIFQKTVSFLARLQSTMFQSREFVSDFCDSKGQSKLIPNDETNKLISSLCHLYKEVIADEHRNNHENAMKSQLITSIIDGSLSMLNILEQLLSEGLFSQSSVSILDLISFSSVLSRYQDAFASLFAEMVNVFERLDITLSTLLGNGHFLYIMQELFVVLSKINSKVINYSYASKCAEYHGKEPILSLQDETRSLVGFVEPVLLLIQKHKEMVLIYVKDLCIQLGKVLKLIFSNISPLRLRVHESLLARSYCKLWFAKHGKGSEQRKDREAFTLFVREDIKSYPLDKEFVTLSLAFFNEMITGRDSSQIVPETTVMKQVREIQQCIAHEAVKFLKTYHVSFSEFMKEDGPVKDCIEIFENYESMAE